MYESAYTTRVKALFLLFHQSLLTAIPHILPLLIPLAIITFVTFISFVCFASSFPFHRHASCLTMLRVIFPTTLLKINLLIHGNTKFSLGSVKLQAAKVPDIYRFVSKFYVVGNKRRKHNVCRSGYVQF